MDLLSSALEQSTAYFLVAQIIVVTALLLTLVWFVIRRSVQGPVWKIYGSPQLANVMAGVSIESTASTKPAAAAPVDEGAMSEENKKLAEKVQYLESKLLEYEILQEEIGILSSLKAENEELRKKLTTAGSAPPASEAAAPAPAPAAAPDPPAEGAGLDGNETDAIVAEAKQKADGAGAAPESSDETEAEIEALLNEATGEGTAEGGQEDNNESENAESVDGLLEEVAQAQEAEMGLATAESAQADAGVENMMANQSTNTAAASAPAPAQDGGGPVSEDDIEALLNANTPSGGDSPKADPKPADENTSDSAPVSEDDIEALLNSNTPAAQATPAAEPAPAAKPIETQSDSSMASESDIEALLDGAAKEGEAPAPAAEPAAAASAQATKDEGGAASEEDIEALVNAGTPAESPPAEKPVSEPSSQMMTEAEIEAELAGAAVNDPATAVGADEAVKEVEQLLGEGGEQKESPPESPSENANPEKLNELLDEIDDLAATHKKS